MHFCPIHFHDQPQLFFSPFNLPNQLICLYQWQLLVFLTGSAITKRHIVTANRGMMMNNDSTKQSPQYPLSFTKPPLRPAGTYWASVLPTPRQQWAWLTWYLMKMPSGSLICDRCRSFMPVLIAGLSAAGWARVSVLPGCESKRGSAMSRTNQLKSHIGKSRAPHLNFTHTDTRLTAACRFALSGMKLCTCKRSADPERGVRWPREAAPSHPWKALFPLLLPLVSPLSVTFSFFIF